MTVAAGTRLGPYEVIAPIGAGGMGEVWRGRDTRLDRSVAIKILPAELAQNAQFKLRFEREAKTISQLSHPNICTLYDVGENYLVMELLDGESLADKLAKGPLPLEQVLRYGVQIADALDKAHRAGIVHRDMKPANIMITKSGAKLLDFGLAKVGAPIDLDGATQHKPLTQEGTILGTLQYMAPEQLEGEEADPRTDIFGLGAVLYEMATGKRAFEGKTKTSLIAAIVTGEPTPMSHIQPLTPPALEHVVRKCLAKDRDDRWQSAHDIAEELRWISEAGSQAGVASSLTLRRKSRERIGWIAALILTALIAAAFGLRRPRPVPVITSSITAPLHAPFEFIGQAVLSPDGNSIAFVGFGKSGNSLWVRAIDRSEPRQLPGTQGALAPFWSPDGKALGFFADGKLRRIAVGGGPPQVICDVGGPFVGGSWNKHDVIIFSGAGSGPLYRVDAAGGKPLALTKLTPKEEAHRWPLFLPDDDHFIFLGDAPKTEDHHIKVGSLREGSSRDLFQAVTNAIYADPGQLLFVRGGSLLAQAFDLKKLTVTGEPRVIAEHIVENGDNHHFEFSASSNGRLTYRSASTDARLAWVDRSGKAIEIFGEPRRLGAFRLSPDERRIAFGQLDADGRGTDIWLSDSDRGMISRLTFDPATDDLPAWSPDGSKIVFSSMRSGSLGELYITEVANPSRAERIAGSDGCAPLDWSHSGKFILAWKQKPSDLDIWMYSTESHQLQPYLATQFVESTIAFSPDDAWVAYVTDESGRDEVYVERFPSHAARRQISNGGAAHPRWRGDGRELFYYAPGGMLMSVDMTSGKSTPRPLFQLPGNKYEVALDGQRFLVDQPVDNVNAVPLTFVSNWLAQ
ncbi:MAG: serine/threonine-protein kinase [Acidobacteriota bacterium]|nr:serine/threonine-protein kinase [Acidobacteriota bacterium]